MYNTWDLTDDARKKLSVLWNGFARMIEPKTNYRLNRFNLQRYRQAEHESVDEYMTRCKLQAKKCNFRDAIETDERLIEQLTVGIKPKIVQNKIPHSASPMVIIATVAPPCGRGGLDTLAYSMYCEWQVYKTVFLSNIRHLSM